MTSNRLREQWTSGEVSVGMLIGIPTATIVDMAGSAGFDWVILDTEHCTYGLETLEEMARAATANGMGVLVRVYGPDPYLLANVLDTGVDGVLLARCSTPDQARELVSYCKLPPVGARGPEPATRAANYGTMTMQAYEERVNSSVVGVMIETKEGLDNVHDILGVKGIDAVFVGPSDLSWSLGVPRDGAEFREAAHQVYEAALDAGVITVKTLLDPEAVRDHMPSEGELRAFHWAADRLNITKFLSEGVGEVKRIAEEYV